MWRLLLLSFIWGWSFLFITVAGEGMTPMTIAWLRIALGALALALIARARSMPLPRGRDRWRDLAIASVLGNVVPFTLLAWATQHIASGLTAVLNASTPLFTALAAAFYLHERLKRLQLLGLAVGFVGVGVAAGVGGTDLTHSSWLGALAAVAAGACYGAAFVFMRRRLVDIPPLAAATGQLVVGAILTAPFALVSSLAGGFEPTPTRVVAVILLGVVGTGFAYILNYRLLADLGPTKTSLVTYIVPIVALALGVLFLDESFSLQVVAGGLLIAAGVALVHERVFGRRTRVPVAPTAAVVLLLAMIVSSAACGGDGGDPDDAACGDVRTEALDPNSIQHVLPNAPEPSYLSDPPTSGPHQPGAPVSGVIDDQLSRPVQVGLLEAGSVLIQHRGDIDAAAGDELAAVDPRVVIAPNTDLRSEIVATAWRHKLECSEVDVDDLRDFIETYAGVGAGNH
jgi:drug/metabolite transporter (DMT)-like permease